MNSSPRQLFPEILERLADYTRRTSLPLGARLPSGRKLAQQWKADFSLVNRAIRQLTSEGVLRRDGYKIILENRPGEPRSLPPLHVIVPQEKAIAGASDMAARYGSRATTLPWDWHVYRAHLRRLLREKCAGVLVWTFVSTPVDDVLAEFTRQGIPAVAMGWGGTGASSVLTEERRAGELAVEHFIQQGHRELAILSTIGSHPQMLAGYQSACESHGLKTAAARCIETGYSGVEIAAVFDTLRQQKVTAVLLADLVQGRVFLEQDGGFRVPEELSIISYGDPDEAWLGDLPLTVIAEDSHRLASHAAMILLEQQRSLRHGGALRPERLFLEPSLVARHSVVPPKQSTPPVTPSPGTTGKWPESLEERRALAERTWEQSYPFARDSSLQQFKMLNLHPLANHSRSRYKGWLGYLPLLHLQNGIQEIHGVPFEIINEKRNEGRSAIVMRSQHARGRAVSDHIEIPIHSTAAAIYWLHAAGWAVDHTAFAEYQVIFEDGSRSTLPVVSYGDGVSDPGLEGQWTQESVIQDWWPSFRQFNNGRSRHVLITEQGDPERYARYLYTLEWINPSPEKTIASLHIQSNPACEATLGLLALTLLRHQSED